MSNDNNTNKREQNARIAAAAGVGTIQTARNYVLRRAGADMAQAGWTSLGPSMMRSRALGPLLAAGMVSTLAYSALNKSTGGYQAAWDNAKDKLNSRDKK